MATKVQAAFRGYLFRIKRKRALAKLKQNKEMKEGDVGLDPLGDGDFDAEAFLDVKMENLEQADIFAGADASLMEKYIQVMSNDYQCQYNHPSRKQIENLQNLGKTRLVGELVNAGFLPPISSNTVINGKSQPKIYQEQKKSFDQNIAKQYFNAAGIAGTDVKIQESRGGSSNRRNIKKYLNNVDQISEIDAQSDNRSYSHQKQPNHLQNNLMGSYTSAMNKQQNQMTSSVGYNNYNAKNMIEDLSEAQSMQSGYSNSQGINPFYPKIANDLKSLNSNSIPQKQHTLITKEEKKRQIAQEWGFEKEETMLLWEARQKKKNGNKKKEILTAEEKLKKFKQNANRLPPRI